MPPFELLISFLKKNHVQYNIQPATGHIPFDAVVIGIGRENEKSAAVLQIHSFSEELTIPEEVRKEKKTEEESFGTLHILQFIMLHNQKVSEEKLSEISQLLQHANRSIPFGSLIYNDEDSHCYYNFSYPSTSEEIQEATFQAIFNTILFVKELFFQGIDDLLTGTRTLDTIIH